MASARSNTGLRVASLVYLASLASALPALGDFRFQGCYTDNRDQRSLTGKKSFDPNMTLQMCAATCNGYQWFGVEYGSQCYCGTSLASTAEKRPGAECSMKCGGHRCQTCGEADRLTVFWTGHETNVKNLETVGGFRYQSCWTDDAKARSLTGSEHPRSDMTVEKCAGFCGGFKYFGVESGGECYCGNDLGGAAGPEAECSELCAGNPAEWCGGPDRLNLYVAVESSTSSELPATSTASSSAQSTTTSETTTTVEAETTSTPESTSTAELTPTPAESTTTTTTPEATPTLPAEDSTTTPPEATPTLPAEEPTTTAPETTPTPPAPEFTNVIANGGFEDGKLWQLYSSGGMDNVISSSLSTERVHSGSTALKTVFSNISNGSRQFTQAVQLTAGATYEASWWIWSENAQALTDVRMVVTGGGTSLSFDAPTSGQPVGQWFKVSKTFTAASSSAASVYFALIGNRNSAAAPNVLYVDDISIVRVA
ncbi:hypothetical protein NEMBOFW57_006596 [Staphylotrichum longicolle]|uniref:WSC domain-containing protein n=1 Tax=Staphylotrichum longicolle TaxID=669026 RepID=A0AAD4ETG5_9PEZI|nr:hypothetical protein NEMBOFW57_006596 [Staphylotrichum longicolle]